MGRVSAISVQGVDLWFNSSDHLPPHLHARKPGHWEVRIYILETTTDVLAYDPKWPPGFTLSSGLCKVLRHTIAMNRIALLGEWEAKVGVQEEPL